MIEISQVKYAAVLLATALVNIDGQAQMATLHYKVGNVAFTEDADHIQILSKPEVGIDVLPGGIHGRSKSGESVPAGWLEGQKRKVSD